ncbi:MAG: two-partner secretion domain-containing protein [Thainema sp.]
MSCFGKTHVGTVAGLLIPVGLNLIWGVSANAQVTSDGTLSTTVSRTGSNFTINNGSRVGNNLFHSFSQFSVPTNGAAIFNNAADVQTIFSRVTGGSASNIDGLIQTNGSANLFLLNSAGILFGPNARLDISGSFVASTASSVLFGDGVQWSTTNTATPPLLTVSVPVGLQLGPNAGSIQVEGPPVLNSFIPRPPTLTVPSGETLALVTGQIDIDNATLTAPDGQIELWAVQDAEVTFNSSLRNWRLVSEMDLANWGTVSLRQASLVNASGTDGGAINIRGLGLTVQDGSNISSNTLAGQGRGITVQTTDFVDLLGASQPNQFFPGIGTSVGSIFEPLAIGRAGNVTVETENLRLRNGAGLFSSSSGNNSRTGDIVVRASNIEVIGFQPFLLQPTSITTTLFSGTNNESGNITIESDRIRVQDGGLISTSLLAFSPLFPTVGRSGDISIRATESFEIAGSTPFNVLSGVSTGIQPFAEGQAGNITINAGRLQISDGGSIRSSLAGTGQAGSISIRATEIAVSEPKLDGTSNLPGGITVAVGSNAVGPGGSINLTADRLYVFDGGQITSSSLGQGTAGSVSLRVRDIDVRGISPSQINGQFLPSEITASSTGAFEAGSVNIRADRLQVRDGAKVTVSNLGTGDAGNLNVWARNVFLDNGGSLQAEVNGGGQGNIRLHIDDLLVLRNGSNITTNAQGASTGGNISIDAGFVIAVADENSDIIANAIEGNGGNIDITTQGIFGLEFRDELTPESDITASSQFGVSGTVQITTINTDPSSGVIELPANVTDPSQQIATGCAETQGSQFIATGRGGVPQNPTQQVNRDRTWEDVRDLSAYRQSENAESPALTTTSNLVETTSWRRNANGQVELIAEQSAMPQSAFATCSGSAMNSRSPNHSTVIEAAAITSQAVGDWEE